MPTEETRFIMESQNVIDQQRAGREDGANQPEEYEKLCYVREPWDIRPPLDMVCLNECCGIGNPCRRFLIEVKNLKHIRTARMNPVSTEVIPFDGGKSNGAGSVRRVIAAEFFL